MCLTTADLSLSWNRHQGAYIGTGYKIIDIVNNDGKIDFSAVRGRYGDNFRLNKWIECKLTLYGRENAKSRTIHADDYFEYSPGFHIFLNPSHAACYGGMSNAAICKVKFKEVMAFGTNAVSLCKYMDYLNKDSKVVSGYQLTTKDISMPCVVARYMKVEEILWKWKDKTSLKSKIFNWNLEETKIGR